MFHLLSSCWDLYWLKETIIRHVILSPFGHPGLRKDETPIFITELLQR